MDPNFRGDGLAPYEGVGNGLVHAVARRNSRNRLGDRSQIYGWITRLTPTVLTVGSMILSVVLLGIAVRSLPLGTAYAVWTGSYRRYGHSRHHSVRRARNCDAPRLHRPHRRGHRRSEARRLTGSTAEILPLIRLPAPCIRNVVKDSVCLWPGGRPAKGADRRIAGTRTFGGYGEAGSRSVSHRGPNGCWNNLVRMQGRDDKDDRD